jgi:hypothetical protein
MRRGSSTRSVCKWIDLLQARASPRTTPIIGIAAAPEGTARCKNSNFMEESRLRYRELVAGRPHLVQCSMLAKTLTPGGHLEKNEKQPHAK